MGKRPAFGRSLPAACAGLCLLLLAVSPAAAQEPAISPPALVGRPAFDFSLKGPDGKDVSLKDHRGKVILLSFWDCYADVCFTSVKALEELQAAYPPEKLVLLTVCYEVPPGMAANNYENLLRYCAKGQVVLLDRERLVKRLYQVEAAPTTFVIDRELVIRERVEGVPGLRTEQFLKGVAALVGDRPQK